MTTKPTKSKHVELLNALSEMQLSPYYAMRRNVLATAERVILSQEEEIRDLKGELQDVAVDSYWKAKQGDEYGNY